MIPRSRARLVLAWAFVALACCLPASGSEPKPYALGLETISEARLRSWVRFLASAELEGRESGARGYDVAALYVATFLEGLGVRPLGDGGSYFQEFHLVERKRDPADAKLHVQDASGAAEVLTLGGRAATHARGSIDWSGEWVFVGHGDGALRDAVDDYSGLSLDGRVVVVVARDEHDRPEREARLRGARRIVVVSDSRAATGHGFGADHAVEPPVPAAGGEEETSIVWIKREVAESVLQRAGSTLEKELGEGRKPPLEVFRGLTLRLQLPTTEARRPTRNVVGRIEGSDASLRDECVVVGAHLDHVGIQGGKIHPGADDDASGVAAVLGTGTALLANPRAPSRSVILVFFAAEEMGLLGSTYFVERPPVPLENMVIQVQLDMVGRDNEGDKEHPSLKAGENVVFAVGSRRHSDEIDPWFRGLADGIGLQVRPGNEDFYARSDQYAFGSRGVPVLFLFTGIHPDYHQPTDTPDRINYRKLRDVTLATYAFVFEVASRPRRLTVNRL